MSVQRRRIDDARAQVNRRIEAWFARRTTWRHAFLLGALTEAPLAILSVSGCFGLCNVSHFPASLPLYILQLPGTVVANWLGAWLPEPLEPEWAALGVYWGLVFLIQSTLLALVYRIVDRMNETPE